jgi:hypothetical protein
MFGVKGMEMPTEFLRNRFLVLDEAAYPLYNYEAHSLPIEHEETVL